MINRKFLRKIANSVLTAILTKIFTFYRKLVSLQPCGCGKPIYNHILGVLCGFLKTVLLISRSQGCLIFNMFIFLGSVGQCLEVSRELQGSLEMHAQLTYDSTQSSTGVAAN